MKRITNLLLITTTLVVVGISMPGCTLWKAATTSVSQETADQLIVAAEKAAAIGADTMDTFVKLDYDHRAAYAKISPKIHEFSMWLRVKVADPTDINPGDPPSHFIPRGIAIVKSVRKATKEFKANRTSAGEANLRTALATLQSVIDDCHKYTALAATGGTQ